MLAAAEPNRRVELAVGIIRPPPRTVNRPPRVAAPLPAALSYLQPCTCLCEKYLSFVGQGVDPDGAFLYAMRRARTEAEILDVCDDCLPTEPDAPVPLEAFPERACPAERRGAGWGWGWGGLEAGEGTAKAGAARPAASRLAPPCAAPGLHAML